MRLPQHIGAVAAMVLVALLASMNYLVGLDQPAHAIWDESYYLTSTQRYENGIAQFASHPPLGLMLIAAGDAVSGENRGVATAALGRDKEIRGDQLPAGFSFRGERLASGVFAVLGAMAFFGVVLTLTQSMAGALLFSNLYVFENAFIVHFRAAHLDAFQIAFAACALWCFAISAKRQERSSPWVEFALGIACGLAMMVKLNAVLLTLLGVMLVVRRVWLGWHSVPRWRVLAMAARDGMVIVAGCGLTIAAVFAVHVAISAHAPDSQSAAGQKDARFVSATYRAYLDGERPLSPAVVFAAAHDYTRFMAADFAGMARTDANGSHPLQWPLNQKTINYRWDSAGARTGYVQLSANPVGGMLALAAPVAAMFLLVLQWWRPCAAAQPYRRDVIVMLLLLYLVFMAVHAYLDTQRVMYLYHYFLGLLLAFCLAPLVVAEAADRWPAFGSRQTPVLAGVTALLLASFVFYAPLTFHHPLTHAQCEWRNVLQHIVDCRQ